MSLIKVHPAKAKDLAALKKISQTCFPNDNRDAKEAALWLKAGLNAFPRLQYFAAVKDKKIVGYISWLFLGGFRSGVVELEQIGISPELQGQGIGEELLKGSLAKVRDYSEKKLKRNLKLVKVDTDSNNRARRFYEKNLGAKKEAVLKDFFYGNDEVIMIGRF